MVCGAQTPWRGVPTRRLIRLGCPALGRRASASPAASDGRCAEPPVFPFLGLRASQPPASAGDGLLLTCAGGRPSCGRGAPPARLGAHLQARGAVLGGSSAQYDVMVRVIKNTFLL